MGHTPLDIAGMYCRREYIDLLREKGAEDEGKVDGKFKYASVFSRSDIFSKARLLPVRRLPADCGRKLGRVPGRASWAAWSARNWVICEVVGV